MSVVPGLHHVTAISGGAQRNVDFWVGVLGMRFVKRTVNFDDPTTYHLYYGDRLGSPGTAMTFFPWEQLPPGKDGVGTTSLTHLAVPAGSLDFWDRRLQARGVAEIARETVFGEERLRFVDVDGTGLVLVVPATPDPRAPWTTAEIGAEAAIRGFHGVTLTLARKDSTAAILTDIFGYDEEAVDGARTRYRAEGGGPAAVVDIVEAPGSPPARRGSGDVHHIAFAVADDDAQIAIRTRIEQAGLQVTPQIDRTYFHSIYFRTPGGVLFEVATEGPGFTVDETPDELGSSLKLPPQHEPKRAEIERTLAPLRV